MVEYDNYSEQTKQTMSDVETYLVGKYGSLQNEWRATMAVMADTLTMIEAAKASIKQHGLYNPSTGRKNPLIATLKDCHTTLLKCVQQLTLSPYAQAKIRDAASDGDADLLKKITGC